MKGTNQTEDSMWEGVAEHFKEKFALNKLPSAFNSNWCSLRRNVDICLAVKEQVMNCNNNGRTADELEEVTRKL